MSFHKDFSFADIDVSTESFTPVPPGWYDSIISECRANVNKKGTGHYVMVKHQIVGPTHEGRTVIQFMNSHHSSPEAQLIGRKQLKLLLLSVNIEPDSFTDTEMIIGKRLKIKVAHKPATLGYAASNKVTHTKAHPDLEVPDFTNTSKDEVPDSTNPSKDDDTETGDIPF